MEPGPYHQLWIHRLMLRDEVRTGTFKEAILQSVVEGDVVLDIGSGSGILSILAAKAGAMKVYAVEKTGIANFARELIEKNGLKDCVKIFEDNIENISLPQKVDVIVSEWMGGFAVDENLLSPLLTARDRWLKPEGKILPHHVTSWMALALDINHDTEMQFWKSRPYEVDMDLVRQYTVQEVLWTRHNVTDESLLSKPKQMWEIDLHAYPIEQAKGPFNSSLSFSVIREGKLNALATWFNATFPSNIKLSNAPGAPKTHWGRYVFPLDNTVLVHPGSKIDVKFACEPEKAGYCHNKWSVRIDNGPWQHHDSKRAIL